MSRQMHIGGGEQLRLIVKTIPLTRSPPTMIIVASWRDNYDHHGRRPLTRREFQSFREELRQDFHTFRRGFAPGVAALRHKSGCCRFEGRSRRDKAELIKWIVGLMFGAIAAATTLLSPLSAFSETSPRSHPQLERLLSHVHDAPADRQRRRRARRWRVPNVYRAPRHRDAEVVHQRPRPLDGLRTHACPALAQVPSLHLRHQPLQRPRERALAERAVVLLKSVFQYRPAIPQKPGNPSVASVSPTFT